MKEEDEKEGILKRLENIEGKNEEQLKAIEDQRKKQLEEIKNINIGSKPLKTISFFSRISEKAKKIMDNIKVTHDWLENAQLVYTKTDGKTKYDFNKFTSPLKFATKIYHCDLTLQKAKDNQQDLEILINKLNNDYNPKNQIKIKEKNDTLKSAKKFYSIREEIINAFSEGIFPYMNREEINKEKA